jgi:hypothetical protein
LRAALGPDGEEGSTTASSDGLKEDGSPKSNTELNVDHAKHNLQKWFDGSQVQEKADKNYAPQQRGRNQRQPRQQKGWGGQKSRDKTSDQPKGSAAPYNYMDGLNMDPEPAHIAEFVSKWCLDSPSYAKSHEPELGEIMSQFGAPHHNIPRKVDSDSKLDSLLSMFPYSSSDQPSLHASSFPTGSASLWVPHPTIPQDPWVSTPFDSFTKPAKKDAIWDIDKTLLLSGSGFGKGPENVDDWSDFNQVKKSFLDIEPQKVYPKAAYA